MGVGVGGAAGGGGVGVGGGGIGGGGGMGGGGGSCDPAVITADVEGVVNKLSFRRVMWTKWVVDTECLLDGERNGRTGRADIGGAGGGGANVYGVCVCVCVFIYEIAQNRAIRPYVTRIVSPKGDQ